MAAPGRGVTGAILLAGGRGSRVGGAVKPLFEVDGRTLLAHAVAAVINASCDPIAIAAPRLELEPGLDARVHWVRESPAFGGPVSGVVAALDAWGAGAPEWTFVLACDLPRAALAVQQLRSDGELLPADSDGLCLGDASSRPQWLAGLYRTAGLRRAVDALADAGLNDRGHDAPVRALVADLAITVVADRYAAAADIDTWEDLERARERAREERTTVAEPSRSLPPEALDEWALALRERFALTADEVPVAAVLDLARDVANGVARPAAPFSAFVAGLVAGKAGGAPDDIAEAVAAVTELARGWQA